MAGSITKKPPLSTDLLTKGVPALVALVKQLDDNNCVGLIQQTHDGGRVATRVNTLTRCVEAWIGDKWVAIGAVPAIPTPPSPPTGGGSVLSGPVVLDDTLRVAKEITSETLSPSKLVASSGTQRLISTDAANWISGTPGQVVVTDDTDGTVILKAPGLDPVVHCTPPISCIVGAGAGHLNDAAGVTLVAGIVGKKLRVVAAHARANGEGVTSGMSIYNDTEVIAYWGSADMITNAVLGWNSAGNPFAQTSSGGRIFAAGALTGPTTVDVIVHYVVEDA